MYKAYLGLQRFAFCYRAVNQNRKQLLADPNKQGFIDGYSDLSVASAIPVSNYRKVCLCAFLYYN